MTEQNNQDLTKIIQDIQKAQRWNSASVIVSGLTSFLTTTMLVWQILKQKKPSIDERMRREEEIQARSKLRMKFLKREADHETELNQIKSGLNSLNELEEKGEELIQNQADQAKKAVENQIKGVKDELKNKLFKKED